MSPSLRSKKRSIPLIDSHVHLTSPQLLPDVKEIIARGQSAGLSKMINICTDSASLEAGLLLQTEYPNLLYTTAATTPHDVEKEGELFFPTVEAAAKQKKLIAIGETGLDYFYEHSPKAIQRTFLIRYLALALEVRLPLIFHCRNAFEDLFSIAAKEAPHAKALLHCFTGTLQEAKKGLEFGWMISFSGIITFKKSASLREVVRTVPLDRLLIETDAPYLAPLSQRGKRNEPAFLLETAECIASIKGLPLEEISHQITENALQFFAIK